MTSIAFSPIVATVVVAAQAVGGVNFVQVVAVVHPTQPIADFMAALRSTMVASFAASESTLGNRNRLDPSKSLG